jgi:hypothetical protein
MDNCLLTTRPRSCSHAIRRRRTTSYASSASSDGWPMEYRLMVLGRDASAFLDAVVHEGIA